jgi:ribosomal protein S12 methylthiotransferase
LQIALISLGCAKNLVDAEIMLGRLLSDGIEVTNDLARADVVIVNTCSFIDAAQEESADAILEIAKHREMNHREQGLVVAGCLPQRFRQQLPELMPEVDAFMGLDQVTQVTNVVKQAFAHRQARLATASASPPLVCVRGRSTYLPDAATPRFRLTPRHFAYLKVAEGCSHHCSFCIIPRVRGPHRSRPPSDVVQEARALLAEGVKELNLISQDTTYYGLDLNPAGASAANTHGQTAARPGLQPSPTTIDALLRELNALPGDFWIRLLYTHPAHWTDNLIRAMADCPKVARYVDLPLQHIHQDILNRMRRDTPRRRIEDLIAKMRAAIPGLTLRTTFIVGFPGETDAHFQTLLDFIREMRFERLGVFTYSQQVGTAAARMPNQVAELIKRRRLDQVMAEQQRISYKLAASFVGRTVKVLVERDAHPGELANPGFTSFEHGTRRNPQPCPTRTRNRLVLARGEADAPEIDGQVYVRGRLPLGQFARVKIIGHTDYDLIADPI